MTFVSILRKLFGVATPSPRPPSRLTEVQAIEIAKEAVGEKTQLYVQDVVQTQTGIEWLIGTATLGSGKVIHVSDNTGKILESSEWGVR